MGKNKKEPVRAYEVVLNKKHEDKLWKKAKEMNLNDDLDCLQTLVEEMVDDL